MHPNKCDPSYFARALKEWYSAKQKNYTTKQCYLENGIVIENRQSGGLHVLVNKTHKNQSIFQLIQFENWID